MNTKSLFILSTLWLGASQQISAQRLDETLLKAHMQLSATTKKRPNTSSIFNIIFAELSNSQTELARLLKSPCPETAKKRSEENNYLLALSYHVKNDTANARKTAEFYQSQYPKSLAAVYLKSRIFISQNKFAQVISDIDHFIADNPKKETYGLLELLKAQAYFFLRDYNKTRELTSTAATKAGRQQLHAILCIAQIYQGRVYQHQNDFMNALLRFDTAEKLAMSIHFQHAQALAASDIAYAHILTRELDLSVQKAEEARIAFTTIGDRYNEARAINILTIAYDELGDRDGALKGYKDFLAINKEIGNKSGIANALHNLAYFLTENGDLKEAKTTMTESLKLFEEVNNVVGQSWANGGLGRINMEMGSLNEGETFARKALALSKDNQESFIQYNSYVICILVQKNKLMEAEELLDSLDVQIENVVWTRSIGYLEVARLKLAAEGHDLLKAQQLANKLQERFANEKYLLHEGYVRAIQASILMKLNHYSEAKMQADSVLSISAAVRSDGLKIQAKLLAFQASFGLNQKISISDLDALIQSARDKGALPLVLEAETLKVKCLLREGYKYEANKLLATVKANAKSIAFARLLESISKDAELRTE